MMMWSLFDMGADMILTRYFKGTVKEFDFQDEAGKYKESGEGILQPSCSLACLWFSKNLKSIKEYELLCTETKRDGPHDNILYPITKAEYFALLSDLKEALTKKDEVAKAIDDAVGDCAVYGRSDIDGHAALICSERIMKLLPEGLRMDQSEIYGWHISCFRDFWWTYWNEIEKLINRLEEFDIDWEKEDLFFLLN